MVKQWFHRNVLARRWLAFMVMGFAFFVFGAGSLNLFFLLKANSELLASYGWQAAMDGGLRQLVELLVTGYGSLAAYLVFKACESSLVHGMLNAPTRVPSKAVRDDKDHTAT